MRNFEWIITNHVNLVHIDTLFDKVLYHGHMIEPDGIVEGIPFETVNLLNVGCVGHKTLDHAGPPVDTSEHYSVPLVFRQLVDVEGVLCFEKGLVI